MALGRLLRVLCSVLLLAAAPAYAHVGATSVFLQGNAGPYAVYVTVAPPAVIPGQAQVSVLCQDAAAASISAQANVLAGSSARNMPEGQALVAGPAGSHEFHGGVWIMTQGSWQVRLTVQGSKGSGTIAVPLAASPVRVMRMSKPFAALLIVLGVLLIAAVASIAAAAVRESALDPGAEPTAADARHGRLGALAATGAAAVLLIGGDLLWRQEIDRYTRNIYQPLEMTPALSGNRLKLRLRAPGIAAEMLALRPLDDLVLDHNHLMHLYAVRWPAMDAVYHLHPAQVSAGEFELALPAMPAGDYRLFADIVHADGFPETAVAQIPLHLAQGAALTGDDAYGRLPAFPQSDPARIALADGYSYRFAIRSPDGERVDAPVANRPVVLRFTLLDAAGKRPADMTDYMGMAGHLAILRQDGSVFAHIHPEGSAAMAAMMMANAAAGETMTKGTENGNVAAFPFGFPKSGTYRLVIQMKHGATVETGAADLAVR
jgi:hypothetical protein